MELFFHIFLGEGKEGLEKADGIGKALGKSESGMGAQQHCASVGCSQHCWGNQAWGEGLRVPVAVREDPSPDPWAEPEPSTKRVTWVPST